MLGANLRSEMEKNQIKIIADDLKIPYLVHFTHLNNLSSILEKGIYPRSRISTLPSQVNYNDELRLDGRDDSVSVSIAFPNSSMFYKYRNEKEGEWVVLILPRSILWELDCAFCKYNAADIRISSQPIESLKTETAFQEMFIEAEGESLRTEQNIKTYDPADVQAEVLVFDVIPSEKIASVVFQSKEARDLHKDILNGRKDYVHPPNKGLFASRGYARKYS